MSTQEKIKEQIDGLGSDVNEILSSTEAVRGPEVAQAVAMAFECRQLLEIMARLADMASEDNKVYAQTVVVSGVNIVSSMATKGMRIKEGDLDEVMSLADQLYDRRCATVQRITEQLRSAP